VIDTKAGAATVSVVSNSLLVAAKIAAGAITGSIAIITEAMHSSIDLIASVVALVSVRKADEPPDPEHTYGHAKAENLAAAIEGMLILIGAGIIIFEATRRLATGAEVENLGVGIAVIAASAVANLGVSRYLRQRAREHRSPALEGDAAHLRADVLTSVGVLVGLGLVEITGIDAFDSIAALAVAAAIVFAGLRILTGSSRVLLDEAPPPEELDRIEAAIAAARPPEMVGYHKLRARRAGALLPRPEGRIHAGRPHDPRRRGPPPVVAPDAARPPGLTEASRPAGPCSARRRSWSPSPASCRPAS